MSEAPRTTRRLADQIIDAMLSRLEREPAFGDGTLRRLREAAETGGLKKAAKVAEAIMPAREGE